MISVEKPGSPAEVLEHVGVKGMKWGVRKAVDTAIGTKTAGRSPSSYKTPTARATQSEHRKKVAKRVAIGVGIGVLAVGATYTAHKLRQSGGMKLSSVTMGGKKRPMDIRIAEQIKSLEAAIKHPDVGPEGKQEAKDLIKMLKSIQ